MSIGLIGTKLGMTREFIQSGQSVPVTVIKIDENVAKLLYGKAMENARKKASLIALTLGKELGDVITVEDNQYLNEQVETSIYYDRPVGEYIYSLQVIFETK